MNLNFGRREKIWRLSSVPLPAILSPSLSLSLSLSTEIKTWQKKVSLTQTVIKKVDRHAHAHTATLIQTHTHNLGPG